MTRTAGEMGLAPAMCICDPMDLAALGHMLSCPCHHAPPEMMTVTGRCRRSEPEMQDLRSRGVAVILIEGQMDFAELELRVLAALADGNVKEIMLDIEPFAEIVRVSGCDLMTLCDTHEIRAKVSRTRPPPDYLKHDPTKQHGRVQR